MRNEELIKYAKEITERSVNDSLKDMAEKFGYIKGKKFSVEDMNKLEEDIVCDEKSNVDTRIIEIIKASMDERYCLCRDFLKEIEGE